MSELPLIVTLENTIHQPEPTDVFRARGRSVGDTHTEFVGVDYTDSEKIYHVHNDNIRAVVDTTGSETIEPPEDDG